MNNYKEKYENLIEQLKKAKEEHGEYTFSSVIDKIIPKLCESEDEKIRKSLIKSFENQHSCNFPTIDGFTREQIIAWLEKQAEKTIPKNIDDAALQYVDTCAVDGEVTHDNITEPYWNNHSMMNAYKAGWLEKQTKQNYIDADEDWYGFVRWFVKERTDNYTLIPSDDDIHNWGNIILNHARKLLEKQGEEKPADKVEPKFKIGDWIVKQYVSSPYVIVDIKNNLYILNDIEGNKYEETIDFVHNRFHLWTIEDANDGDVLSYRNGQWIFIYKEKIDDSSFDYHILYSTIHQDLTINDTGFTLLSDAIIPATKEYRDLLIQKMKEAEYEWYPAKKELKKIEQNHSWSGKDEEMLDNCIGLIQEIDSTQEEQDWLKSLKNKVQPQPKQEWSEEDEENRINAIKYLEELFNAQVISGDVVVPCINWLKSLKPKNGLKKGEVKNETVNKCPNYSEGYGCSTSPSKQCDTCPDYKLYNIMWKPSNKTWKPTEYQLKILWDAICYLEDDINSNFVGGCMLESLYKDLKKL